MKNTFLFILIFTTAIFAACQKAATTDSAKPVSANAVQTNIEQISPTEAKAAVENKDAQFVDVRTVEEYKSGHAAQTINLPLDALDGEIAKLDPNKPVYLICQTGRRSQKAAELLEKNNFKKIYNIQGGTTAWQNAGLPIDK